jgi:hypothetical protein
MPKKAAISEAHGKAVSGLGSCAPHAKRPRHRRAAIPASHGAPPRSRMPDAKHHLKNESSARVVPVHSEIARAGFFDYVAALPADGLLFPGLKPASVSTVGATRSGSGSNKPASRRPTPPALRGTLKKIVPNLVQLGDCRLERGDREPFAITSQK